MGRDSATESKIWQDIRWRLTMDEQLHDRATEMFRLFARFEYALKATGFHNGRGDAKPDWRAFAASVAPHFEKIEDAILEEAVAYIQAHPPKKQVIKDGLLEWDESLPETDLEVDRLLIYVRRVRNNLFHGGKFNGHWFAPERSDFLLRHSMTILRACLNASPALKEAFDV